MRIDDLDAKIISAIFGKDGVTTTEIAKIVFNPKCIDDLRKGDDFIRKRLNRYCEYGILKKEGKNYFFIEERVKAMGKKINILVIDNCIKVFLIIVPTKNLN